MLEPYLKSESETQKQESTTKLVKTELSLSKYKQMAELKTLEKLLW